MADDTRMYNKRPGTTGAYKGQMLEIKLVILFIIRAVLHGVVRYSLGRNIEEAGDFEDLVVEYAYDGKKSLMFVQAKHVESKKKHEITEKDLSDSSNRGKFGIQKYYKAYKNIKTNYHYSGDLSLVERHFIIYTNAEMEESLQNDFFELSNDLSVCNLLNTSIGRVYVIKQETRNTFIEKFFINSDKDEVTDFVSHLKFFTNQYDDESTLDLELESNISKLYNVLRKSNIDLLLTYIQKHIVDWANKPLGSFITESLHLFEKYLFQTLDQIDRNPIFMHAYKEEALKELRELIREKQIIEIIAPDGALLLTKAKVIECIADLKNSYFVTGTTFLTFKLAAINIINSRKCSFNLVISIDDMNTDIKRIIQDDKLFAATDGRRKIIFIYEASNKLDLSWLNMELVKFTDDKLSLNYLNDKFLQTILQKSVHFQEKRDVKLEDIVDKDAYKIIDGKAITKLINNESLIISNDLKQLGVIKEYYVRRKFSQSTIVKRSIFSKESVSDLVIIPSNSKIELEKVLPANFGALIDETLCGFQKNVLVTKDPESFRLKHPTSFKGKNVHFLEIRSSRIVWIKTEGSISFLLEHMDQNSQDDIENIVAEQDMPVQTSHIHPIIIADTAGTGKSTVFTSIANELKMKDKLLWIERVDLNSVTEIMQKIIEKNEKSDDSLKILCKFLNFNTLEGELFQNHCKQRKSIVVMFDGFDEIISEYQDLILNLVEELITLKLLTIWVTTRPEKRNDLETRFGVFSYTLVQLNESESKNILVEFWKHKHQIKTMDKKTSVKFDIFTKWLIKNLTQLRNACDKHSFCGIPLQVRMAAEIYSSRFKDFYDSDCSELKIEIKIPESNAFYQRFFDMKLENFCIEKQGLITSKKNFRKLLNSERTLFEKYHQLLSVHLLFNEKEKKTVLNNEDRNEIQKLMTGEEDIHQYGIVDVVENLEVRFIHRTFAEFFAAKFIIERVKKCRTHDIQMLFHNSILVHKKFHVTRIFINFNLKPNAMENLGDEKISYQYLNDNRDTPLHVACEENHINIILHLFSILKKYKELMYQLLAKQNSHGHPPIHVAVKKGHLDVVKCLLEYIVDVNIKNNDGDMALHEAAMRGHLDVIKCLLEYGADVKIKNNDDNTALHEAAMRGHLDVIKCLLEYEADVTIKNIYGETALHDAAMRGHLDVVKCLLENGADVNIKDIIYGSTALHDAAWRGHLDVVKCLLENGADVKIKNISGDTALHDAAMRGHLDVVKCLLENGADVNIKKISGDTALHHAISEGHLDVVKYLIEHNADENVTNNDNLNALQLATRKGRTEIVTYIQQHIQEQRNN